MFNVAYLDVPDIDSLGAGTWTFGDFGPAHEDIQKMSGIKNANVKMNMWDGMVQSSAVLAEDGETLYFFGFMNCVETMKWQTKDNIKKLSEDREPIDEPSCPYKIQPENQGKLIWLSGPPGAGKSTTAQLMAKEAGYVYFEADCAMVNVNPFIPIDAENPSLATMTQKPLKVKRCFHNDSRHFLTTVPSHF